MYDICVVGGGSGGFGAALAAARRGKRVVLIEGSDQVGGNAGRGGVTNWEMGVVSTPLAREVYERLRERPGQAAINRFGRHFCWADRNRPPFPGGEHLIDEAFTYEDTLQRHGVRGLAEDEERVRKLWHAVVYEPEPYARVLLELMEEAGCEVRLNTFYRRPGKVEGGRSHSIWVEGPDGETEVSASVFIDSTADAYLCQSLGCVTLQGTEPQSAYGEPSAPDKPEAGWVNSITLIFRVRPVEEEQAVSEPPRCWFRERWGGGSFVQMPSGRWNVNMLPTMEGDEFLQYFMKGKEGYRQATAECRRRVEGFWNAIQWEYPEFRWCKFDDVAPALGVRETRRVLGERVLTQNDVMAGISRQTDPDVITLADHAMDLHGNKRGLPCSELQEPYGVPFRCLIPKGRENLLVACRAASFTQIAASSCRLSRTMMGLGHAAGVAGALLENGGRFVDLDSERLREELRKDGMLIDWDPGMTKG